MQSRLKAIIQISTSDDNLYKVTLVLFTVVAILIVHFFPPPQHTHVTSPTSDSQKAN